MNRVELMGFVGNDPEIKVAKNYKVCSLRIATNKMIERSGRKEQKTQWHTCIFWKDRAENAKRFLRKGSPVHITGELTHRSYEKDGITRHITEVQVVTFKAIELMVKSKVGGGILDGIDTNIGGEPKSVFKASKERLKKQKIESETIEDDLPF